VYAYAYGLSALVHYRPPRAFLIPRVHLGACTRVRTRHVPICQAHNSRDGRIEFSRPEHALPPHAMRGGEPMPRKGKAASRTRERHHLIEARRSEDKSPLCMSAPTKQEQRQYDSLSEHRGPATKRCGRNALGHRRFNFSVFGEALSACNKRHGGNTLNQKLEAVSS
jgi:hypothetical protein